MSETPTITIHTDVPCPECGKPGASGEDGKGRCLECVGRLVRKRGRRAPRESEEPKRTGTTYERADHLR